MQGVFHQKSAYNLPQPYNLKPRPYYNYQRSIFTTPMKKFIGYFILLGLVGIFILTFGPEGGKSKDTFVSLDTGDSGSGIISTSGLDLDLSSGSNSGNSNSDSDTGSSGKNSKLVVDKIVGTDSDSNLNLNNEVKKESGNSNKGSNVQNAVLDNEILVDPLDQANADLSKN
ncbi:hypothetical protein PACTADRAFT_35427 [Pachysolen tannophilus NRRL Y-2460]|uniref:Uncharacterized protein n=1 Tax=Pachysolen tannophilus NRRL Y-2460 TaxID=669874 RepID=A0A1E4TPS1_PACTA|nr:hypothetical protein PACTADRAFT_35427 [Pachysolen tannophilus NRRL Y-2460]